MSKVFTRHRREKYLCSLTIAVTAALATLSAQAEESVVVNDPVVVTATRIHQPLSKAASSISVIMDVDIEEKQAQTLSELLVDIPNVDVTSPESIFFNRISIRGSNEHQITYLIDGVRQDDHNYGGNRPNGIFVDPEILKQVEIRHGGGSALYGNGGIGGVLSVTTKTAADFLGDSDKDFGALAKVGYGSGNLEWSESVYAYGRNDFWDVVLGVTRRDSGAAKTSKEGKRSTNDVDGDSTSFFAKAIFSATENNVFALSYNYDLAHSDLQYRNDPDFNNYRYEQHRITGSWEYESGNLVNLKAALQYAQSRYRFDSYISYSDMNVNSKDKFDSISGNFQNTSTLHFLGNHAITYGVDVSHTKQSGLGKNALGLWDDDPSRPDAAGWDAGFFIEDVYDINDYVSVAPMLRWSYFKRESKASAGYDSLSDYKFTPGITLKLTPNEQLMFWGSVTTGYRPPILDEMYFRQDWSSYGIVSHVIPNPDLKPEKSTNYELGASINFENLALSGDNLSARAAFFYHDVKDFINIDAYLSDDYEFYYKADNIGHVVNKGFELSAGYNAGNFRINASYGYIYALDKEEDTRVAGIAPQSANLRLGYKFAALNLEPWYRMHWSKGGKSSVWVDEVIYQGDYTTHSIGLIWQPKFNGLCDFSAGLTIENLTDEKYRTITEGYGYARNIRIWMTAKF